jgi:ribosomal peptide maturation radical SAM protein 1
VPDVALVSMPFGPVFSPSIALSLLQAELAEHHLTARIHYFTIRFAETIGQAFYSGIAEEGRPALEDLAGEWLFARALFETTAADDASYVSEMLEGYYSDALIARLLRARERVNGFLDECLETLLRERPAIIGFTSVFQQHTASLALARRLKQELPSSFVIFGGANCEGIMGAETVRSFPFVDAAMSGEADLVFPELVRRVLNGAAISDLPGVRSRDRIEHDFASRSFGSGPMVREMDRLPVPDYRDYFEQFKSSRYDRHWQPSVFIETSRGCWWGERMHCTFCGLNGTTMAFRSKSASRALSEVNELVRRHPDCDIQAVDNILDLQYFKDVLPALAAHGPKVSLFYETKSNLRKEQVRLLRDAGVREIQPGIESFSDPVLKLMRKGVTGLQNIQLLKWCKEFGLEPSWNFLWGFPGEPPEEYERLARLVPMLTHLPAPDAYATIRLDRFSPNFFDAERLGFTDVKPKPAYRHIYRLADGAIANLACYFSFDYQEPRDVDRYTRSLARELEKWRRAKDRSDLVAVDAGEHMLILDLRPKSRAPFTLLKGLVRLLYAECDSVRDLSQLLRASAGWGLPAVTPDAIQQALVPVIERGLLLQDGTRYLALAIPLGEYVTPAATNRLFAAIVRRVGIPDAGRWIVPINDVDRGAGRQRSKTKGVKVPHLGACRFSVDAQCRLVVESINDPRRDERRADGKEESEGEEEGREGWSQAETKDEEEVASENASGLEPA